MHEQTIREKILDQFEILLETMQDDNGDPLWNYNERGNLDALTNIQLPAMGMEEGDEEIISQIGSKIDKILRIFFNFKFQNEMEVDVYTTFNYYLGRLQQKLLAKKNLGDYTINVSEAGSSPEIADKDDPQPGGILFIDVHYRHINANPYSQ